MTEKREKPDERLEQMLRQWGAQEAADTQAAASPGVPARPRVLLRWLPTALAAMLMIAAGITFYMSPDSSGVRSQQQDAEIAHVELKAQIATGAEELAEVLDELRRVKESLLASDGRRLAEGVRHRRELAALKEAMKTRETQLADARLRVGELEGKLVAQADLEEKVAQLRRLKATRDKELARLIAAQNASAGQLETLQAESTRRAAELAAARRTRARQLADARAAYFSAAAPGLTGLAASQTAARRSRMLYRCRELRRGAAGQVEGQGEGQGEETRRLLDRLEAALMRLDMMDTTDASQSGAFMDMVAAAQIDRSIEQALVAGQESDAMRKWLVEAQMILSGASGVG